jgi:formylglycine-generating enzyme required for sulfatase activity
MELKFVKEKIMHYRHCCSYVKTFLLIFVSLFLFECDLFSDKEEDKIYFNSGTYNFVEVPVPNGGIDFPIGVDDDDTARVDKAFYIGDSQITFGLWQAVAYWATFEKSGEYYSYIYFNNHEYQTNEQQEYPICGVTYMQAMVWCNAYTEWFNEKNNTNFTPVYVDGTGKSIRIAKKPLGPSETNPGDLTAYIYYYPMMEEYLNNKETSGTGFRLPTPEEWELAARWRGTNGTNSVTGTINGINFAEKTIKFTKGNSVSGADDSFSNLKESHKYAVFEYNSKGKLFLPKTKLPNALNIYDMCGNLREFVYHVRYLSVNEKSGPFAQTRGGYFDDTYGSIAIGSCIYVDATAYNYYYGFRVARNK